MQQPNSLLDITWQATVVYLVMMTLLLQLRNEDTDLCVDTKHKGGSERFGLSTCLSVDPKVGGEQVCHSRYNIIISQEEKLDVFPDNLQFFCKSGI